MFVTGLTGVTRGGLPNMEALNMRVGGWAEVVDREVARLKWAAKVRER
jgi:hypothetical protein